jgi:hypothetical protein
MGADAPDRFKTKLDSASRYPPRQATDTGESESSKKRFLHFERSRKAPLDYYSGESAGYLQRVGLRTWGWAL